MKRFKGNMVQSLCGVARSKWKVRYMKQEEQKKLERLYALYEQPMYRVAFAVLHQTEAAEDAVSDAFMKVMKHIRSIKNPDSEETKHYMIKVIRTTAFTQYRKLQRKAEWEVSADDSMMQIAAPEENKETVSEVLKTLKTEERELVLLRCAEDLSWQEISRKLGVTETCARKRFERVRKYLIKMKGEL